MWKLIVEFNDFFEGSAGIEIVNGQLEISIGTRTMIISLPEFIGGQGRGK